MTLLAPLILCFRSSFTFHVFHVTVREDSPRFQGTPHQRPFADPWFGLSLIQMQVQSRFLRRTEGESVDAAADADAEDVKASTRRPGCQSSPVFWSSSSRLDHSDMYPSCILDYRI